MKKITTTLSLLMAMTFLVALPLIACAGSGGKGTVMIPATSSQSTVVPFVIRSTGKVLNHDPATKETVSQMCYKGTEQLVVAGHNHMPSLNRHWTDAELNIARRASVNPSFGKNCSNEWHVTSDSNGDIYLPIY